MTNGKNSENDNIDYPKETELSYKLLKEGETHYLCLIAKVPTENG